MIRRSIPILLLCVIFLLALGLVMLGSTYEYSGHGTSAEGVLRHLVWLGIGGVLFFVAASVDYHWWKKLAIPLYILGVLLLALCYVPGIGVKVNGARRWIEIGYRVQPAEFARVAMVFLLAFWFARKKTSDDHFLNDALFPILMVTLPAALIVTQVDMGSTAILLGASCLLIFLAGCSWKYLVPIAGVGLVGFVVIAFTERAARLFAFTRIEETKADEGMQQWMSMLSFGHGGITGQGIGNGYLKMFGFPYAHTDFIFPVIGEELGLVFTLFVVLAFTTMFVFSVLISMHAPDLFGRLLGFGLIVNIALQAVINMGVTTAMLPNSGMPLPFVSMGGSNIIASLFALGILINIYRQGDNITPRVEPCIRRSKVTPRRL